MIYGVDKECEPGASPDRGEDEKEKNRKDCMKKAKIDQLQSRYILFYDLIGQ
jgi:hypothetical protein